MRALFVAHSAKFSGANRSFFSIIENLCSRVYIMVVVNAKEGELIDKLDAIGVPHRYCKYDWWDAHARSNQVKQALRYLADQFSYRTSRIPNSFIQELRHEQYDVVYTNTSTVDIGAKLAKKLNIPHVWHVREFGEEDFSFIPLTGRQYRSKMFNSAKAIIVISTALKDKYIKFVHAEKLTVIYNGFEIKELDCPSWKHDLSKQINVLVAGQVSEAKGQDTAIKAVYKLKKKGYPIKLFIAGAIDHDYIDPVLKKFPQYSEWCDLLGTVNNIYELRKSMDIELICSRSEAFGRVTIEAMLHSIPVIGSDAGGTSELIKHKQTGLLFEYGNADQLADNIQYLVDNERLYYAIIRDAYEYAKSFTIENTVRGVEEVLNRVVCTKHEEK